MLPGSITPFYFGRPDKALFGCFHEPRSGARRFCGVVVSPPVGHEYVNSHRALRQLAALLANAGFPVLRFDYYGCGDSSGEEDEASLSQWVEDTSMAVSEVRRRGNLGPVCLIGLRLGGTIAMMVARAQNDLAGLVLWDPVTNGREFLETVLSLQKQRMRFRRKPKRCKDVSSTTTDLLGFALNHSLRDSLEEIDMSTASPSAVEKVLIIKNDRQNGGESLPKDLIQLGALADYEHLSAPKIWEGTPEGTLLVPNQVLRSIVSWMVNKFP